MRIKFLTRPLLALTTMFRIKKQRLSENEPQIPHHIVTLRQCLMATSITFVSVTEYEIIFFFFSEVICSISLLSSQACKFAQQRYVKHLSLDGL